MKNQEIADLVESAKVNKWMVGLFGWGVWGKAYGIQIVKWLGLNLDFVSDSDENKIHNLKLEGVKKLQKKELLKLRKDSLVIVCIGQFYLEEVVKELKENECIKLVTLDDVLDLDIILEKFYGVDNIRSYEKSIPYLKHDFLAECKTAYEKGNRIAVYTCIVGGYDDVLEPLIVEDMCDYYLISDVKPDNLKVFSWIDVKTVVPENIKGFPEMNRYCKMYGESIFQDYKYSIYMDGKIQLIGKIANYINEIGKIGVGVHKHGFEDCIYTEGMRLVGCGTCDYIGVRDQMRKYLYEGMPRNYGLFECCMIVRDHSNYLGKKIMHQWFEEYMRGEKRDQFSLTYVLWKNGLSVDSIGTINNGEAWKNNQSISRRKAHLK